MPLHFKGLSEYKRNFKWNDSRRSNSSSPLSKQKVPWAGLPSDQLGNTKEPNFISKKRVPYYRPQASKSFQWDWSSDSNSRSHEPEPKISELMKPQSSVLNERGTEKAQDNQEESKTPNAPREPKVARSRSADCHLHSELEPSLARDRQLAAVVQKGKEDNMSSGKKSGDKAVHNGMSYAFKETAPLKTVPQKSLKKNSEYQRQFAWKSRMDNSPLLTAEQIFHSRNKHVHPFKFSKMLSETEYSSQFKGMQPPKGLRFRKDFEGKEALAFEQENLSPIKSTESTSKDQGQETKEQPPQDKQLLKQQNPHKPICSRKGLRKIKSEYKTKFRPPCQYDYSRGAYRSEGGTENNLNSYWYAEVKELREKAEAYKRRALGTHFSRDHLTQILSEQNRLWEVSSSSDTEETVSDNVETLDLARTTEIPNTSSTTKQELQSDSVAQASPEKARAKYNGMGDNSMSDVPTLPVSRKLAWNDEEEKPCAPEHGGNQSQNNETEKEIEIERNAEVETVIESDPVPVKVRGDATVNSESNGHSELDSDAGGRLPTPKLKSTGGTLRTHHDLTTPAVGGAVLVSPCKVRLPPSHCRRREPPLGKSYSPYKYLSESPSKILKKTESLQQSPTAGVKTSDPIPMREEYRSANLNSPSHAKSEPSILTSLKFHPTVNAKSASVTVLPSQNCPHRIQGTLRHPEFQHNGNTGGLRASLLRIPPTDPVAADNEDDRMSQISARSAASSSLASQVLERAQKRRDNFWVKNS
ncbi:nuclear protein MDM1 isoform X1 [Chiloscyllium plagiosum]|uniref:nuclear protein MDM1 isoform X1 n=1 Tax=Chiloscyllium plagiosum TaxID=36176 RepID=UPI001CB84F13|nr:nuclear protein MDM1 isoform X1 [Chiloscyllium plagiosum]